MNEQQQCANPIDALLSFFTRLTPEGRSSRADFWWVMLFVNFPGFILAFIFKDLNSPGLLIFKLFAFVFVLWADYCLFSRRLHDIEWGDVRAKIWLGLQICAFVVAILAESNPISIWTGISIIIGIIDTVVIGLILVAGCYKSKPAENAFGVVPHCTIYEKKTYTHSSWMARNSQQTIENGASSQRQTGNNIQSTGRYAVPVICGLIFAITAAWIIVNKMSGEKDRYVVTKGDNGIVYRTDRFTGQTDMIKGSQITHIREEKDTASTSKDFENAKAPVKLRSLDSSERSELTGRAGMGNYGFYEGTIYNGNSSICVKEVIVSVSCLKGEESVQRKYIAKVDIAPLTSGEFSFRMVRGDEDQDYKYSWYIDSAKGYDINE